MPEAEGFDFIVDRDLALTIGCRYCGSKSGEPCTTPAYNGDRHPLEHFPAHPMRVNRAKRLQRMQAEESAQ
ncbi:hypothetical protein AXA44_02720 [Rhodococcus sp. SC4]|nr:hypothetical protein AXA44_02720 [Rhodococcus sp. SC4]